MTPPIDISRLRGADSLVAFDLDDTLAAEFQFIRSGARHIAAWLHREYPAIDPVRLANAVDLAILTRRNHYSAIESYLEELHLRGKIPMASVVSQCRNHFPDYDFYHIAPSLMRMLEEIKASGSVIALVTDGRSITQRNKITALGLDRIINPQDIFISEETSHDKMHPHSFLTLMEMHPDVTDFHYVGDNLAKDFLHPSKLGWTVHLAAQFPLGVHCGLPR